MSTSRKNAYEELIAAGRLMITKSIREWPIGWKYEDMLTNFLIDYVQPAVVPDGADLAWALTIIELKPEILHRENQEDCSTAWGAICESIGEQVIDDLRKEFEPITDRLIDEDWDQKQEAGPSR